MIISRKAMGIEMAAIMIASILAMIAPASVAAKDVPPGEVAIYCLVPKDSSAPEYCENATVQVWLNSTINLFAGEFTVNTNPACGDIVIGSYVGNYTVFDWLHVILKDDGTTLHVRYGTAFVERPPGVYHIGNFKMHCNSNEDCITDLNFIPDVPNTFITNFAGDKDTVEESGTFICGGKITFIKDLYEGWSLISLPLTASDNSANSVLASVWENVTGVYRYNETSKEFESATTMDPGEGYFVHVTKDCVWNYRGTAYSSMNTKLKQGLNMLGWLNCSMPITDALLNISGDYNYAARWNATSREFEVYEPDAPNGFNDFDTMERGEGYFIAAKKDCTLAKSCPE